MIPEETPRRSPKNLPYPENESCLDIECLKYGTSCCGADPTGEQCIARYCHDRVLDEKPQSCHRAFGQCDPHDSDCVPNCPRFIDCYNRGQKEVRRVHDRG